MGVSWREVDLWTRDGWMDVKACDGVRRMARREEENFIVYEYLDLLS